MCHPKLDKSLLVSGSNTSNEYYLNMGSHNIIHLRSPESSNLFLGGRKVNVCDIIDMTIFFF